ncbi:MAG: lysophospholipase L1-like esterase [Candidatus Binatia bacterium]|jgi:lysophospholipase L1-like esterase
MNRTVPKPLLAIASFSIMGLLLLTFELSVRFLGIDAVAWPSLEGKTIGFIRIDPLLGALPEPDYAGKWFGFDASFDSGGFRNTGFPPSTNPEIEAGDLRKVAFLGDSCTFGWGLEDSLTFTGQLDQLQRASGPPRLALRNAGYPGHSAVMGPYVFRQRVLAWQPDVVVLGYSANNAFRFATKGHRQRFQNYELRSLLLQSQTYRALASRVAAANHTPRGDPRSRATIMERPLKNLHRIASLEEFEDSTRKTIKAVLSHGADPVLMVFPRSVEIQEPVVPVEDVAIAIQMSPFGNDPDPTSTGSRELGLLEASCLDHLAIQDPVAALRSQSPSWKPVRPSDPKLLEILRAGAKAFVAGDTEEALDRFAQGVALDPASPLARYDLGVTKLKSGDPDGGLDELARAEKLACNVFLSYQVALHRIAVELEVSIIDLVPVFQVDDSEELFLDPAHPNATGSRLIAEALWARLGKM